MSDDFAIKNHSREVFAKRLKETRQKRGVSVVELGRAVGMSHPTISLIEHGERLPSFITLVALAEYLDVSIDYLVGFRDEAEANKARL